MEAEFDTVARWTEEVVARLGPGYALPAACRGSASPAALDWLVTACGLGPGSRLADVGGGIGGPAAYAREAAGARPVVVEPMFGACHAGNRMFGLDTVVGAGERVPLADGAADAAWCLGVLCTTGGKRVVLSELRRILAPGRPLGLLVFTADEARPAGSPIGNEFPTLVGTRELLVETGFAVEDTMAMADLPDPPDDWTARTDRFDDELARAHGDDPRFAEARDQSARIGGLVESGEVAGHLLLARAGG